MPYIYDYYNVKCFTPNPNTVLKDVLARLLNCFVKALNDHNKLPRLVIVIPDLDILKHINHFGFGVKYLIHEAMQWLLTQFSRAVESKVDFMRRKKPGSIIANEPKFIWVKAINRLNGYSKMLAMRNKFNNIMESHLAGKVNHYVIDISDKLADRSYCDANNTLNGFGRQKYWQEIDRCIELFDKRRITLRPLVHAFQPQKAKSSRENDRGKDREDDRSTKPDAQF